MSMSQLIEEVLQLVKELEPRLLSEDEVEAEIALDALSALEGSIREGIRDARYILARD